MRTTNRPNGGEGLVNTGSSDRQHTGDTSMSERENRGRVSSELLDFLAAPPVSG